MEASRKEWAGRKSVLGSRVVSSGRRAKGADVVLQVATMRPGGEGLRTGVVGVVVELEVGRLA